MFSHNICDLKLNITAILVISQNYPPVIAITALKLLPENKKNIL